MYKYEYEYEQAVNKGNREGEGAERGKSECGEASVVIEQNVVIPSEIS